ncbi:hypothetical protein DV738_g2793, partial [Chaetothyriales sp. CBS 135597]
MASPALSASRATAFDFRRPNEYPILLGDSLRNKSDATDQLLNLRYNWQPSTGLRDVPGTLKKTSVGYSLALGNDASDTSTYYYKGHARPEADDTGSYALVFNKQKSAFLLEKLTKSIDMNVEEGPSIRYEAAKDLRQLPKASKHVRPIVNGDTNGAATDNEEADHSNPFDFRHFLAQAKETAEKSGLPTGGNTPRAGGGTPVPGFPSPLAGPSRFGSTTPLVKPTPLTTGPQKKRRVEEKKGKTSPPLRQRPSKKAESKAKDRIYDSDNDTIVAAKLADKDAAPNISSSDNLSQSQHIVVNDGGLEIDIGSPPREDRERKRGRLDLSAFRGPMDQAISRSRNRALKEQSERKNTDSEQEEDADIEELELGSPRSPQISTTGGSSSVLEPPPTTTYSKPDHAPTPTDQPVDDDYDDLAAEFEAALDEADDDANDGHTPYGLGISGAPADNEESEVSEEE